MNKATLFKRARRDLQLTQKEMASLMGWKNKSTIGKWESGERNILDSHVFELYILTQYKLTNEERLPIFEAMQNIMKGRI